MDFPATRRKINTYGKGSKKVWVHDLFDLKPESSRESTPLSLEAPFKHAAAKDVRTTHAAQEDRDSDVVDDVAVSLSATKSVASSTTTSSPPPSATEASNMFNIQSSSDDGRPLKTKPPMKRRKVTTAGSKNDAVSHAHDPENVRDMRGEPKKTLQRRKPTSISEESKVLKSPRSATTTSQPTGEAATSIRHAPGLKRRVKTAAPSRAPLTRSISPEGADSSKSHRPQTFRVSSGSSANLSDASQPSGLSRRSTPKRKRALSNEDTGSHPSPSDLHLNSLRLTPDAGRQRQHRFSSEDEDMTDGSPIRPARKVRMRLIDRLDAPRSQSLDKASHPAPSHPAKSAHTSFSQPTSGMASPRRISADPPGADAPSLDNEAPKATIVRPLGRQRATYAKQRSHLSDMVDGLDSHPGSNSLPSSQVDFSQTVSFTSLGSQMELDNDDSDDAEPFNKIKSIHELRRGGAIRKFDLDMDTILEDVESDSKSRRIPALLQLQEKLNELSFMRHFQDSGSLQRLMDCVNGDLDTISSTLIALVFQHMISIESSSPKSLLQMLQAIERLPAHMASETRSLSKLAKDRTQNISRLLLRDIVEFDGKRSKMLGTPATLVNLIFLSAMESAQRSLIELKEDLPKLPRSLRNSILSAFNNSQGERAEGVAGEAHVEGVRLLLSLLEIACANHELAGSSLSSRAVSELGESVACVMMEARQGRPQIEHSCLRLIVSLSNNEPNVCEALVGGRLVDTVFLVINDHFSTLADLAAQEKDFDHAQLEAVILAVGCLLNFAECTDAAREKMLQRMLDKRSVVDSLVDIFNGQVDQASEALTIDQTQILVAFGYISALLCTLCLNLRAREQISRGIKGEGLAQLLGAADTFIHHLETVEAALGEEGGSSTGFTTRFNAVLESVRS